MSNLKKALIVTAFASVFSLALLEIAARLFLGDLADAASFERRAWDKLLNSQTIFGPDDQGYSERFGFQYSPNSERSYVTDEFEYTVRTNSLGFRSQELVPKQAHEYRVMLLGDSFVWGNGLNRADLIATRLEEKAATDDRFDDPVSVHNFAVGGYNTVQQSIVLSTYGAQVQPDHVVVGFFVGNDVIPNAVATVGPDGNYRTRPDAVERITARLRQELWPWSASAALRPLIIRGLIPRLRYRIALAPDVIKDTFAPIEAMAAEARDLGARFTLVIIYPRDGVQGGLAQSWSNSRSLATAVRQFCEDNDIAVVDLLDYLQGPDDNERYFFQHDGHFNPAGAAKVADVIYDASIAPARSGR